MSADKPVLLYAHPSMHGLAKAIVASCEELKANASAEDKVCYFNNSTNSNVVLID